MIKDFLFLHTTALLGVLAVIQFVIAVFASTHFSWACFGFNIGLFFCAALDQVKYPEMKSVYRLMLKQQEYRNDKTNKRL